MLAIAIAHAVAVALDADHEGVCFGFCFVGCGFALRDALIVVPV